MSYLSLFYSKNHTPNGPNYTKYANSEYDRLYEQSLRVTNITERNNIYRKMEEVLLDDAPIVILYYDQILRFTQKDIHHLHSNAMNMLNLKLVQKH